MSIYGEEVYRQRFTATEKVVETLNNFLTKPQTGFNFYSKQIYTHNSYPPITYDEETGEALPDGMEHIRDHVEKIQRRSKNMGARTIHLAQNVTVSPSEKIVRLNFTPVEGPAYFEIIRNLHGLDPSIPDPDFNWSDRMVKWQVDQLVEEDLFVDLQRSEMSRSRYSMAREALKQTLASSDEKYLMAVEKVGFVDHEHIPPYDNHATMSA
jgi:hypothetical protein